MVSFLLVSAMMSQPQDAVDRHAAYMSATRGVTVDFTVKEATINALGRGTLEIQSPNLQKFTIKWGDLDFEYRHSRLGGLSIRNDWKEYFESQALITNGPPPPMIAGLSSISYPMIISATNLLSYSGNQDWDEQGVETVRGLRCDKLTVNLDNADGVGVNTVWIDQEGKIQRWHRVIQTPAGSYDITLNFRNHRNTASVDLRHYDMSLPIGFVPTQIPFTRSRTVQVAQMAVFGNWKNVWKDVHEDVANLVDGVAVAIVFTDPDCEISKTIEPFLVKLKANLKRENCYLIEVSLGRKSPSLEGKDKSRPIYWDQLGSIETAYGTPGTPYFLLANKEGQLVRGWQGYSKQKESEIILELLRAFKD